MFETIIREGEEVWTSDDVLLGVTRALFFRPADEVNPLQKLYAVYLEVVNFVVGDDIFIPLDFLEAREEPGEPLRLTVPVKVVLQESWSRAPDFVAMGQGHKQTLSRAGAPEAVEVVPAVLDDEL